jgi:hypothetical protein
MTKTLNKKMWSKFAPGMTAVVISEPDYRGFSMAWVTDEVQSPEGPIGALINTNEWSLTEVVPVPDSVPDMLWVAYYGDDPTEPKYKVFSNEVPAALFCTNTKNSFGYGPVTVQRNLMTALGFDPRTDTDE